MIIIITILSDGFGKRENIPDNSSKTRTPRGQQLLQFNIQFYIFYKLFQSHEMNCSIINQGLYDLGIIRFLDLLCIYF